MPDANSDERDEDDETWVLYDRQLVDDELYSMWAKFAPGVRIFVLSDSCHSGTVTRAVFYQALASTPAVANALSAVGGNKLGKTKALPLDIEGKTYKEHQALYDQLQKDNPDGETLTIDATVILISGCQDNQLSSDGSRNGLFTEKFLHVWKAGGFKTYRGLHRKIENIMPPVQSPTTIASVHPTAHSRAKRRLQFEQCSCGGDGFAGTEAPFFGSALCLRRQRAEQLPYTKHQWVWLTQKYSED